mmetsp:Transcript_17082/g.58881  ORF Transcript_17082/g.58881 Transcript_17082/m.58881 type:complete len:315 (+) Transcript_17082:1432-2376(+)
MTLSMFSRPILAKAFPGNHSPRLPRFDGSMDKRRSRGRSGMRRSGAGNLRPQTARGVWRMRRPSAARHSLASLATRLATTCSWSLACMTLGLMPSTLSISAAALMPPAFWPLSSRSRSTGIMVALGTFLPSTILGWRFVLPGLSGSGTVSNSKPSSMRTTGRPGWRSGAVPGLPRRWYSATEMTLSFISKVASFADLATTTPGRAWSLKLRRETIPVALGLPGLRIVTTLSLRSCLRWDASLPSRGLPSLYLPGNARRMRSATVSSAPPVATDSFAVRPTDATRPASQRCTDMFTPMRRSQPPGTCRSTFWDWT